MTRDNGPLLLGVDIGTTHCKAGLFSADGSLLRLASRPTITHRTADSLPFFDPEEVWTTVSDLISEAVTGPPPPSSLQRRGAPGRREGLLLGVTSMAEAGLLIDAASGAPRTHIIPWYDTRSLPQAEWLARAEEPRARFRRCGLHPSFKYSLAKLLWLREREPALLDGARWLSVSDYVVFRLTGAIVTDPTLAGRTYAQYLAEGVWDAERLARFDIDPRVFPRIVPSGTSAGEVRPEVADRLRLPAGTTAAVAGHDHLCTQLAAGIVEPGTVMDSMGTAESLLGVLPKLDLGDATFDSGFAVVPHVLPGRYCWLGGISSSGGSLAWLRGILGEDLLTYEHLEMYISAAGDEPTGILYFPYLAGRGTPRSDGRVRAAFVGLSADHGRPALAKSVVEGTCYESEAIRRAAQGLTGRPIDQLVVVGGGARIDAWLQIKADVTGCVCHTPALADGAVLGAALTAALGAGALTVDDVRAIAARQREAGRSVAPNPARHARYRQLFENGYEPLLAPLHQLGTP